MQNQPRRKTHLILKHIEVRCQRKKPTTYQVLEHKVIRIKRYAGEKLKPIFSVIITAHDRTRFLNEAIDSVKSQSLDPELYEIVVITNFPHETGDKKIRTIVCKEKNAGATLAEGIESARGSLIAPLDDDDMWEPHRLEKIRELMSNDQSIAYYHNQCIIVDEQGNQKPDLVAENKSTSVMKFSGNARYRDIRKMQSLRADWNSSSIVFKKVIVTKNLDLLKKISKSVEMLFFYSALLPSATIAIDTSRLTKYRIHGGNTSTIGLSGNKDEQTVTQNFKHHLRDCTIIEDRANKECSSRDAKLLASKRNMLDDRIHLSICENNAGRDIIGRDILSYISVAAPAFSFYDLLLVSLGVIRLVNPAIARTAYFTKLESKTLI